MVVEARSETADLEEAREKLIQSFSSYFFFCSFLRNIRVNIF